MSTIACPTNEYIYACNKKCTCVKCWKEWLKYNFEYIKTLSKDEMAEFIMGTISEAFNIVIDDMWKEWLDKEHK